MSFSACAGCGAPIRWGRCRSGDLLALDAEPCPDGNLVLGAEGFLTTGPAAADLPRFRSHLASCPAPALNRPPAALPPTGSCRGCGAPLHWVRMESGKAMPLDCEPHPRGTVRVYPDGRAAVLNPDDAAALGVPLYRSHFATCPHASRFRKET